MIPPIVIPEVIDTALQQGATRRKVYFRQCRECGQTFQTKRSRQVRCGSDKCKRAASRRATQKWQDKERDKKNVPLIECAICGKPLEFISFSHAKSHGLTIAEYRDKFPGVPTETLRTRELKGKGGAIQAKFLAYDGQAPDSQLFEFLVGTLLGDGNLSIKNETSNARYAEGGSNQQYLTWKQEFVSRYFPCRFKQRTAAPHVKSGESYTGWWIRTGVHPLLTEWYRAWYPNGVKVVERDLVERWLSPLALTVWYCDDGHLGTTDKNAYLYTMAFSESEVLYLQVLLQERFGLVSTLRYNQTDQPFLYFGPKGREVLLSTIQPYIPPGMEYKGGN